MDDDQFLWPISSSPLFVPQSPPPSPSAFTYQTMRRRQTASPARRRGKLPVLLERTRSKLGDVHQPLQQQSHSTAYASASGSGSGSGSGADAGLSSASSTPQSSFSSGSIASEFEARAKGKRPMRLMSVSRGQSRRPSRERSENAEQANKRRRIVMQPYDALSIADSAESLFGLANSADNSYEDMDDLFDEDVEAADIMAPPPVIDLTDDFPVPVVQSRRLQRSPRSEIQAREHSINQAPHNSRQDSRPPSGLGSRTAPILIDDFDAPVVPRTADIRAAIIPQPHRDASIEILDTIVARQQEDAVAAQSNSNEETFTTLGNMNCVICMDSPRNLSMVPCGHVFCGACITEALRHSESRIHEHTGQRKAACPVCREPVYRSRKEHIVPILLKKGRRRQAAEPFVV